MGVRSLSLCACMINVKVADVQADALENHKVADGYANKLDTASATV